MVNFISKKCQILYKNANNDLFNNWVLLISVVRPVVAEKLDVAKCVRRCTFYSAVNPSYVQPCLASCNLSLGKEIEKTLAKMPFVKDPVAAVDYDALYRESLQLQNQLVALKKAFADQLVGYGGSVFPDPDFVTSSKGALPIPIVAPVQSRFPIPGQFSKNSLFVAILELKNVFVWLKCTEI